VRRVKGEDDDVAKGSGTEATTVLTNSPAISTMPESFERGRAFFLLPLYL
jgi:hypothetical protein